MPYFVVVQYQALPDRADDLLAVIRHDFEVSANRYPGRRFARVFRHDRDSGRFLAIEEWLQQADFEQHALAPAFADAIARHARSSRTGALARLQHFRHMSQAPTALACAIVSAPAGRAHEVESYICDEQRREVLIADGLVLRAVYRIDDGPGRLLVLHGWSTPDGLRAYFATREHDVAASLLHFDARVEQCTGQIAAQFSWLDG